MQTLVWWILIEILLFKYSILNTILKALLHILFYTFLVTLTTVRCLRKMHAQSSGKSCFSQAVLIDWTTFIVSYRCLLYCRVQIKKKIIYIYNLVWFQTEAFVYFSIFLFLVGAPINVNKVKSPTAEEVDKLHCQYITALQDLFDKHKRNYGIDEDKHLIIC